ncbi:hypothetical protein [Geminocystis sp. GBBB08]|uniref:hypothetical protein n=1 Tax=Geminocystis sp. GBBB08 TaxID=2604140 RepID=UPI0027E3268A|nr:hypothetical protein [Geminocystis sp. GBBB08]MBL1211132.1 hypothetical protein [Geminocystis sp. GBBB08]
MIIPCLTFEFNSPPISHNRISEEVVAEAIAHVIESARYQGQSLDDLVAEVLEDDPLLDQVQRQWLSKIVTQAWQSLA